MYSHSVARSVCNVKYRNSVRREFWSFIPQPLLLIYILVSLFYCRSWSTNYNTQFQESSPLRSKQVTVSIENSTRQRQTLNTKITHCTQTSKTVAMGIIYLVKTLTGNYTYRLIGTLLRPYLRNKGYILKIALI